MRPLSAPRANCSRPKPSAWPLACASSTVTCGSHRPADYALGFHEAGSLPISWRARERNPGDQAAYGSIGRKPRKILRDERPRPTWFDRSSCDLPLPANVSFNSDTKAPFAWSSRTTMASRRAPSDYWSTSIGASMFPRRNLAGDGLDVSKISDASLSWSGHSKAVATNPSAPLRLGRPLRARSMNRATRVCAHGSTLRSKRRSKARPKRYFSSGPSNGGEFVMALRRLELEHDRRRLRRAERGVELRPHASQPTRSDGRSGCRPRARSRRSRSPSPMRQIHGARRAIAAVGHDDGDEIVERQFAFDEQKSRVHNECSVSEESPEPCLRIGQRHARREHRREAH